MLDMIGIECLLAERGDKFPDALIERVVALFGWMTNEDPAPWEMVLDRLYKLAPDLTPVAFVTPRTDATYGGGVAILDDGTVVAHLRAATKWFYRYPNDLAGPPLATSQLVASNTEMFSSFTSFHQTEVVQPAPYIPVDLSVATVADVVAAVAVGDPVLGVDLAADTVASALAKFHSVYPGILDPTGDTTAAAINKMVAFYGG